MPAGGDQPIQAASHKEFSGAILSSLGTAVVLLDDRLRVRDLNTAAAALLATGARAARGRPLGALGPAGTQLAEFVAQLGAADGRIQRGIALERADGPCSVDCAASRLGPDILLEIVPLDWHQRMARYESLLQQDQAANALIRGLAHEIKNPLGGLRGAAQLLQRRLGDPDLREYTQVILHEADRLNQLLSRLGGLDTPLRAAALNIHEVVDHVRVLTESAATEQVTLRCDYDPSLPELNADRDQLIQALLNLTRNAIQAVGEAGTITLRTRMAPQHPIGEPDHGAVMVIEVIDDGPGVPDRLRDSIFYPMVTGRAGGTGLGLSVAQAIARRHAGLITCDSRPGRTCFALFLPLQPEEAPADA